MKSLYKRENLKITEFDTEDVITTSGLSPIDPVDPTDPTQPDAAASEIDNALGTFGGFNKAPGSWF